MSLFKAPSLSGSWLLKRVHHIVKWDSARSSELTAQNKHEITCPVSTKSSTVGAYTWNSVHYNTRSGDQHTSVSHKEEWHKIWLLQHEMTQNYDSTLDIRFHLIRGGGCDMGLSKSVPSHYSEYLPSMVIFTNGKYWKVFRIPFLETYIFLNFWIILRMISYVILIIWLFPQFDLAFKFTSLLTLFELFSCCSFCISSNAVYMSGWCFSVIVFSR